uniref:Uncharacterized protein n=1 Tax=Heliothis virescens TaxID=7102 RepID=A0A2A4IUH6_HELVI
MTIACISAFSEDDIVAAKNLLFESIPTIKKQKKTRKRDGKTLRNIDDIINALKETDPEEIPIFVARELQKLPPILFDHVDVTKILKDLLVVQQDISRIKEQFATTEQLDILKCEIDLLKHTTPINTYECNVNTRRGAGQMESFEGADDPLGSYLGDVRVSNQSHILSSPETVYCDIEEKKLPAEGICDSISQNTKRSPAIQTGVDNLTTSNCQPYAEYDRFHNHVVSKEGDSGPKRATSAGMMNHSTQLTARPTTGNSRHTDNALSEHATMNVHKTMADVVKDGEWKREERSDGWTTVQRRRYRNRFAGSRGKAVVEINTNFKAAEIKVPIYIYNVAKDVTVCDINKYVTTKSKLNVTVEKMKMRLEKEYNSFKVFVPKDKIDLFMDADFWPIGVAYRRFVEFRNKTDLGANSEINTNNSS